MKKPSREILKPDFSHLVLSIASTALLKMGLDSRSKEEKDRNMARYNIDLLSVLKEKTKNNLTKEEAALLDSCIQDLQLKFVQTEREASSKDLSENHPQSKASEEASSENHLQNKNSGETQAEKRSSEEDIKGQTGGVSAAQTKKRPSGESKA